MAAKPNKSSSSYRWDRLKSAIFHQCPLCQIGSTHSYYVALIGIPMQCIKLCSFQWHSTWVTRYYTKPPLFYPRGASSARVIAIIVCLCVCLCVCLLSVTRRYCTKTAKRRITQTTPLDSPRTLVFWRQKSLVDDPSSPWNLCSEWPTPFQTA